MNKLPVVLIAFVLIFVSAGAKSNSEESWPYRWSRSMADSQKLKRYLFSMQVEPTTFEIGGHEVSVYEAWREKCGSVGYLMFKLKIDGNVTGEHRISMQDHLLLSFKQREPAGRKGIDYYAVNPIRRLGKRLAGKPSQEFIHLLYLGSTPQSNDHIFRLQVGSYKTEQTKGDSKMSNVCLTFKPDVAAQ